MTSILWIHKEILSPEKKQKQKQTNKPKKQNNSEYFKQKKRIDFGESPP